MRFIVVDDVTGAVLLSCRQRPYEALSAHVPLPWQYNVAFSAKEELVVMITLPKTKNYRKPERMVTFIHKISVYIMSKIL